MKHDNYMRRMQQLSDEITKIDLDKLDIRPEDLKDPYCNPEKPINISFNDISAAAYRLKGGIENTPCTVRHKFKH